MAARDTDRTERNATGSRGRMRRVALVPYVLLPLSLFSWQPAFPGQTPDTGTRKDQIQRIETDLLREKELFLKFDEREKSLLTQLSELEKEVAEKKTLLKELEEKIAASRNELKVLQSRLGQLERSLRGVEDRLAKRLDTFYRNAKRGYARVLATSEGLDQLRKRLKYLSAVMQEDRRSFEQVFARQARYYAEISTLKEKIAAVANIEKAEENRLVSAREELDQKALLLMKTHKEKEFYETAVKELEAAAQRLKETVLSLERKEERKALPPSGFAPLKGKLPFPLEGKIIRSGGPSAILARTGQKGIFIEARPGVDVRAIFQGRVDFSGALKGYGQVVIINHGSRFFTISAQLSRRDKQEGESVKAGEVIGLLGQAGAGGGNRLYFEIRRGGEGLNPSEWLKAD